MSQESPEPEEAKSPEELLRENLEQARRADGEGFRFFVMGFVFFIAVIVGAVAMLSFWLWRMGV